MALLLGLAHGAAEAAPVKKSAKKPAAAKKKPAEAPVDPYADAPAPAEKAGDLVDPYGDAPAAPTPAAPDKSSGKAAPPPAKPPAAPPASASPLPDPYAAPGATKPAAPVQPTASTSSPSVAPAAPASVPAAPAPSLAPSSAAPAGAAGVDPAEAQLAEEIAFSVAARAQELLDAKQYADAKQLAIEAIARSPRGVAAERAQLILRAANTALGIPNVEDPPPAATQPEEGEAPTSAPAKISLEDSPTARRVAQVHSGLYGGLIGAAVGGIAHDSAGVEIAVGAAGAAAGAYFLPRYLQRYSAEQVRTIGSASVWGGALGGLIADVTTSLDDTSPRQVLLGAALGSTVATAGGLYLAKQRTFTRGDVALVDTLASIGAAGGLTLGLAMQPVQGEGYSLNAALGAAAGIVTGFIAAPQTNTSERRMLRVAGAAAAGGAAPWLVYLAFSDSETNNDEQAFGLISTAGLLAGAYFGLRWTRGMDAGKDVHDASADLADAPPAILRRSSRGELAFGGLGLRTSMQAPERAYVLDVLSGRF